MGGSATLLSEPPISNHSRVLGVLGQPKHAEVPSAECGAVNVPRYRVPDIKTSDKSEVWSWGAVKRTPSSQNFPERKKLVAKRRKPEQNNVPILEVKNVKGLVLPQPPRIIKKA